MLYGSKAIEGGAFLTADFNLHVNTKVRSSTILSYLQVLRSLFAIQIIFVIDHLCRQEMKVMSMKYGH